MRITPEIIEAAYDYLRVTEPFAAWKLPEVDDLGFHVSRSPDRFADFIVLNGVSTIRVNEEKNTSTLVLMMTVAHEMIHLYQHLHKLDTKAQHNADFKRRAVRVCKSHGWDQNLF